MKIFLILTAAALVLVGLAACSDSGQESQSAGADAAVTEKSEKTAPNTMEQNVELARAATKKLGGALKSALQTAMGEGGPQAAVGVCHDEAAAIAQQICDEEGLIVGRTSTKFRSPDNAPDAWETVGLAAFTARMAAGEKPKDLEMWANVTEADGNRSFRYLKAIPTAPLCLKCHGSELSPDLAGQMAELYPGDQATGFAVGDMRGAFTVKIELPSS